MDSVDLSVIVCTYNPNIDLLNKCLEHLSKSISGIDRYELIMVDNNSTNDLIKSSSLLPALKDLNYSIIRETKQGLTPARIAGINQSRGKILCFIDDDNLVYPDFLNNVMAIARDFPFIGAFSGQVILKFESPPEKWVDKYKGLLVSREFTRDTWSNMYSNDASMPCGAGMIIKREVGEFYRDIHLKGKRPIQLDRSGGSLLSGGDNDLAMCAIDLGFGTGLFSQLKLDHFIPNSRTQLDYLLELNKSIIASSIVLNKYRNIAGPEVSEIRKWYNKFRYYFLNSIDKKFALSAKKGVELGQEILKYYENTTHS